MKILVCQDAAQLGREAARLAAATIQKAIAEQVTARVVLSTGNSQLETLQFLVKKNIDWSKVVFFHLDEYVGIDDTHPASFQKYLKERVFAHTPGAVYHLVDSNPQSIPALTQQLRSAPIDLGLIGVGENAHIAFNDPPANLETSEAFIVVNLEERCKRQQVGEGWFASLEDVPEQAITMTVSEMMRCKHIISAVPHSSKAPAVAAMLKNEPSAFIPAAILKSHPRFDLVLDQNSAAEILPEEIAPAPNDRDYSYRVL